jgi:ribonuclease VapC
VNYVIDSSALLAVLQKETGYLIVVPLLMGASMSAVNLSEVLQKAEQKNLRIPDLAVNIRGLGVRTIPFCAQQAELAANLWTKTSALGLSLGDRACLALAQTLEAVAITADQTWVNVPDIQVRIIR